MLSVHPNIGQMHCTLKLQPQFLVNPLRGYIKFLAIITYPLPRIQHNKGFHKRCVRQTHVFPLPIRQFVKFHTQSIWIYCKNSIPSLYMLNIELRTPIGALILNLNTMLLLTQTLELPVLIHRNRYLCRQSQ